MIATVPWHPDLDVTVKPGGTILAAIREHRQREQPRHGLHVSTIVDDIERTIDPRKYERYDRDASTDDAARLLYQELGNALENILAADFARRFSGWVKPAPKTVKGITGSPDGWVEPSRTIDEMKATWVSPRDFLDSPKFQTYMRQSLAYAHMWDARRVRLHVLFVSGATGRQPEMMTLYVGWQGGVPRQYFQNLYQHAKDRGWL